MNTQIQATLLALL